MRRRITIAALLLTSVGLIGVGAGCGSGDSAASTPADATTVINNAVQTDSEGKTVPAPGTTGTGESGGSSEPGPAPDESGGASAGNAAIGKTVFEATCQGCHTAGGTVAGVGPKLTLSKLDSAAIRAQIVDGKGFMPGGLVSGDDLANVVAFVDSIKK